MNKRLIIAVPEECLAHVSPLGGPERPERLSSIRAALGATVGGATVGGAKSVIGFGEQRATLAPLAMLATGAGTLDPRPATEADLLLVHTPSHVEFIRKACARSAILDFETGVSPGSWNAALFAAGTVLAAADAVADGRAVRAFAAVRPPGHHAGPDSAAGFCLFNNVALAARHLARRLGVARVAIVDFDAHHGNGTEEIFRNDPGVLYCSLHQYGVDPDDRGRPYYPGTGGADVFRAASIASKAGAACRSPKLSTALAPAAVNCPLPAGTTWSGYARAMADKILPALDRFAPGIILVSAGFDAHREDPLSRLELESADFGRLTSLLVRAAEKHCAGKIVSALEGGYDLPALAESVIEHLRAVAGD